MNTAIVLTPWIGSATPADPNRPQVLDDYPGIYSYENVTGQAVAEIPPDPNLYAARIRCTPEILDLIAADPAYYILEIDPS